MWRSNLLKARTAGLGSTVLAAVGADEHSVEWRNDMHEFVDAEMVRVLGEAKGLVNAVLEHRVLSGSEETRNVLEKIADLFADAIKALKIEMESLNQAVVVLKWRMEYHPKLDIRAKAASLWSDASIAYKRAVAALRKFEHRYDMIKSLTGVEQAVGLLA